MAGLFEERKRAAEWAFAHEGEVRFLMHCNALRALAGYAAQRLGRTGEAADAYAEALVAASVDGVGDEALIERVRVDLDAQGIAETAASLRERMALYAAQAVLSESAARPPQVSD